MPISNPAPAGTSTATGVPVVYNDEGTFAVSTTGYLGQRERLTLTGTERASLAGTGRVDLFNPAIPSQTTYYPTSFTILPDNFALQYQRLSLRAEQRATLLGNSEIVLTAFAPVSRLVLTGVGGGT